jgi:predicted Zn-dependent protease
VIRVVALDEFDPKLLGKLCNTLYQAFGVGCESAGLAEIPPGLSEPFDANQLLEQAPGVRAYQDDKVLYLTSRKLKDRALPSGTAPTVGVARYARDRALVTIFPKKALEEGSKLVGRLVLHQVGHLWELHHCLDPRCAMYPPWTPSYVNGDAIFCTFCREKSEQKIRLAKS